MRPTVELLAYQPAVCSDRSTTLQLLVRLRAPQPQGGLPRPCLNVGLAIDHSGSMTGLPLQRALQAGEHLITRLQATDYLSLVAFNTGVSVLSGCGLVGPDPRSLIIDLLRLQACGGTALHQGWLEGCHQAQKGAATGRLSRVLLLSDGEANQGLTDSTRIASQVAQWQRRGITTSTIGLGEGYNEDLLSAMARAGNGSFYHVRTPEDIVSTFQVELHSMASTFGQAVSLGVQARNGVELLRVINPLDMTRSGRLCLADLVHGCPIDVVLEFLVPEMAAEVELCDFRLAWTEVATGQRQSLHETLRLPVVPHGQLSEFPVNEEVARKRALQLSARIMSEAIDLLDRQDRAAATKALNFGLHLLSEAGQAPELDDASKQFRRLLSNLAQGAVGSARKEAKFYSSSVSLGSVAISSGIREFMALPPEQRTPEKMQELMGIPKSE